MMIVEKTEIDNAGVIEWENYKTCVFVGCNVADAITIAEHDAWAPVLI